MKRLDLRTRRQIRLVNAQYWADFKQHWPMELLQLLLDTGSGFLAGVALALSLFVYLLLQVSS